MDYYGQTSAATVPTGRSPTWYEAVNSEFYYEQNQIQDMKSTNHQIYTTSMVGTSDVTANRSMNVHERPLTKVSTTEQSHTNIEYYQQPISMHFNNDANYLTPPPPIPPLSSSSSSLLPSSSPSCFRDDGNAIVSYAPCQGPRPWNFAQCYGFYGQPACPLVNIIDMEDFMWVSNACQLHWIIKIESILSACIRRLDVFVCMCACVWYNVVEVDVSIDFNLMCVFVLIFFWI